MTVPPLYRIYFVHPTLHATLQLLCPQITPSTLNLPWLCPNLSSIVQSHRLLIVHENSLQSTHIQSAKPDQMERAVTMPIFREGWEGTFRLYQQHGVLARECMGIGL